MDSHGLRSEKVPENFRYQVQRKMYIYWRVESFCCLVTSFLALVFLECGQSSKWSYG